MTEGTARDYAWAFKGLLKLHGREKRGTAKMQNIIRIARPKLEAFVKLPQFAHASAVQACESAQTTTFGGGKVIKLHVGSSKVAAAKGSAKHPLRFARFSRNHAKRMPRVARVARDDSSSQTTSAENCDEEYVDFAEFQGIDEDILFEIAEKDPRVQALLDAGDMVSDSAEEDENPDVVSPFKSAPGLRPQEDIELWDFVCAAIWPEDS